MGSVSFENSLSRLMAYDLKQKESHVKAVEVKAVDQTTAEVALPVIENVVIAVEVVEVEARLTLDQVVAGLTTEGKLDLFAAGLSHPDPEGYYTTLFTVNAFNMLKMLFKIDFEDIYERIRVKYEDPRECNARKTEFQRLMKKLFVEVVNDYKLPLMGIFDKKSLKEVIEWVRSTGDASKLRHVDVSHHYMKPGDLKSIVEAFPNARTLNLAHCGIKDDSCKYLKGMEKLKELNLAHNYMLPKNALEDVSEVKTLKKLSLEGCGSLSENFSCLAKLVYLRKLNISGCHQFTAYSLSNLYWIPWLKSLDISGGYGMKGDILEHLKHVKGLKKLAIRNLHQMDYYSLRHLEKVSKLEVLKMRGVSYLDPLALDNLQYVPNLRKLDIESCRNLSKGSLFYLQLVPQLEELNVADCVQLDKDFTKFLKRVPKLQKLNLALCSGLNGRAMADIAKLSELRQLHLFGTGIEDTSLLSGRGIAFKAGR